MQAREVFFVEYSSILTRAGREGWLPQLLDAHAQPCTQDQAQRIMDGLALPANMKRLFGNKRGRARFSRRRRQYGISLPTQPGGRCGKLRAGLVLHEAAHILDHMSSGKFGHGEKFCRALRQALTTNWRTALPTTSFATIFNRHRGPFSIMMTREVVRGKVKEQASDRLPGPFTAEEAHEEARMLVGDPRENVTSAFVFSETEGQFIGACYNRGTEYKPWHEENAAVLDNEPVEVEAPIMIDEKVFDQAQGLPDRAPSDWKPIGTPEPKKPSPPRKIGLALQVAAGRQADWPKSLAAQEVLKTFEARGGMTAKEATEALGLKMVELGVAHPASLISRLKQAGLLTETEKD